MSLSIFYLSHLLTVMTICTYAGTLSPTNNHLSPSLASSSSSLIFAYLCGPHFSTLLLVSPWVLLLQAGFHKLLKLFSTFFLSMCLAQPNLLPLITPTIFRSPNSSLISMLCFLLLTPSSSVGPICICRILHFRTVIFTSFVNLLGF